MSKYEPLWKYVEENNKDEYKLSFEEIGKKELLDYGYEFKKLSLKEKWVKIERRKKI